MEKLPFLLECCGGTYFLAIPFVGYTRLTEVSYALLALAAICFLPLLLLFRMSRLNQALFVAVLSGSLFAGLQVALDSDYVKFALQSVDASVADEDRINMAEVETKNAKDGFRYLIRAKVDFADFVLSSGRPKAEAIASLSDAVSLDPSNAENATLLSAILLEDGSGEPEVLLKSIFDLALPEDESGDGYDYEDFAKVKHAKILNILMALRHHAAGDAAQTRKALKTAALAAQLKGRVNPKRHVLVACLEAAEYLLANKLFKSAQKCLDWVSEFEAKAKEIAADCGASTAGAKEVRPWFLPLKKGIKLALFCSSLY